MVKGPVGLRGEASVSSRHPHSPVALTSPQHTSPQHSTATSEIETQKSIMNVEKHSGNKCIKAKILNECEC
jgi:hypothetical protein